LPEAGQGAALLCAKPFALDPNTPKRIAFVQKMRQLNGTYCSLRQAGSMTAPGPEQTHWRAQLAAAFDRGCVKTSFNSKSAANPPDFRKLQFAKALISLKLKF
jgi:hypothetical protein